jgi:ATP-dependent Clp endopeptidase proteolytic subunit ClpP
MKRKWFDIVVSADGDVAEIYIYGRIGKAYWDDDAMGAKEFTDQLRDLRGKVINLHVNSPGGDVVEGLAIYNAIKRHNADVHAYVDGWAASAASFIIMACTSRVQAANAFLMIHKAWTLAIGNADDMREEANILDKFDSNLADMYQAVAGEDNAHWLEMMKQETYYTAEEALAAGLITEIGNEYKAAACIEDSDIKLFGFSRLPDELKSTAESDTPPIITKQGPADPGLEPGEASTSEVLTRKVLVGDSLYTVKEGNTDV